VVRTHVPSKNQRKSMFALRTCCRGALRDSRDLLGAADMWDGYQLLSLVCHTELQPQDAADAFTGATKGLSA